MKIGILIDYLIPGGVQLTAIEQTKELNKLGHSAQLLILTRKKSRHHLSLVKATSHTFLSDKLPDPLKTPNSFPFFSFFSTAHLITPFFATRLIKKKEFDIILSHGTSTCFTAQAILKKRNIPYIAVIHDPIPYILTKAYVKTPLSNLFPILFPLAHFFEKQIGTTAQQIVIDSTFHANRIKKTYGQKPHILPLAGKPLKNIPNRRGNQLLAISRWQKEKTPQLLLQILKALPKAKLTIAGNWSNLNDLFKFKQQANHLGVSKRLTVIEKFDTKQLKKLFKQARVWIHPNSEAFGMGGIEAASHGAPIIMPQDSGVASLFEHGLHGFFPKNPSLEDYLPFITKLINNERLAWKMGHSAWKKVKQNYTWKHHTTGLLKIINTSS